MNASKFTNVLGLALLCASAAVAAPKSDPQAQYLTLTRLAGDWSLSAADRQEGKATSKGPAAKMVGTNQVAMRFRIIGKGSTVQENLLPGTPKEMATMYHCNQFSGCTQVRATHYCAKQNQPALVAEPGAGGQHVSFSCDMSTALCNSKDGHVHQIQHELSDDNNHLKTTYRIFKDGKFQKASVYHFDRMK